MCRANLNAELCICRSELHQGQQQLQHDTTKQMTFMETCSCNSQQACFKSGRFAAASRLLSSLMKDVIIGSFRNWFQSRLCFFWGSARAPFVRNSNRSADQGRQQRSLMMSRVYLATACLRGTPVSQHACAALKGYESCIPCDGQQRA